MKSRWSIGPFVLAGLTLAGATLAPLVEPTSRARRMAHGASSTLSTARLAQHGATLGVLGGFRAIAADLTWLRGYLSWERRDAPATETLLRLATGLDPRPLNFWLNGARIIAYDIPTWRTAARGGETLDPSARDRLISTQAHHALDFLAAAAAEHPASSAVWIERGNIELNQLHDLNAAAESYRRASLQPDAPFFAARVHAELLRRAGRKAEALAWLVDLHPHLAPEIEAAAAEVVLMRIRELERDLAVPAGQAYHPTTG